MCAESTTPLFIDEFITQNEHDVLWNTIYNSDWNTSLNRRVQHYGYNYDYKNSFITLKRAEDIPESFINILFPKFIKYDIMNDTNIFNQCIVNEYVPGQGIGAHTDHKVFGDTIVSITLGSQCVMNFTQTYTNADNFDIMLTPKSAIVLSGDFRWKYKHAIKHTKSDKDPLTGKRILRGTRVSITFRHYNISKN